MTANVGPLRNTSQIASYTLFLDGTIDVPQWRVGRVTPYVTGGGGITRNTYHDNGHGVAGRTGGAPHRRQRGHLFRVARGRRDRRRSRAVMGARHRLALCRLRQCVDRDPLREPGAWHRIPRAASAGADVHLGDERDQSVGAPRFRPCAAAPPVWRGGGRRERRLPAIRSGRELGARSRARHRSTQLPAHRRFQSGLSPRRWGGVSPERALARRCHRRRAACPPAGTRSSGHNRSARRISPPSPSS